MAILPNGLSQSPSRSSEMVRDFLGTYPLGVRLFRDAESQAAWSVQIIARFPPVGPDLLVYWIPATQTLSRNLPDDARLLGAFVPEMAFALPPESVSNRGRLLLYSLANQEVLEASNDFVAAATTARADSPLLAFNILPATLEAARSRTLGWNAMHQLDASPRRAAAPICGQPLPRDQEE
ncbi:MAG: hypothetical protein KJ070_23480 [Verrucomicrobia bacterium]|nr:hypothetical protein [Verrucomicrobiota bacterium]